MLPRFAKRIELYAAMWWAQGLNCDQIQIERFFRCCSHHCHHLVTAKVQTTARHTIMSCFRFSIVSFSKNDPSDAFYILVFCIVNQLFLFNSPQNRLNEYEYVGIDCWTQSNENWRAFFFIVTRTCTRPGIATHHMYSKNTCAQRRGRCDWNRIHFPFNGLNWWSSLILGSVIVARMHRYQIMWATLTNGYITIHHNDNNKWKCIYLLLLHIAWVDKWLLCVVLYALVFIQPFAVKRLVQFPCERHKNNVLLAR